MLVDMHPDVSKLVWMHNRWHHHVNYSKFTQKLKLKDDVEIKEGINNRGMVIIPTEETNQFDSKGYLEDKYADTIANLKYLF